MMHTHDAGNTHVTFKLGEMYDITIHLISSEEELNSEIIEQAMMAIQLDIGIDIEDICKNINMSPYDKNYVTVTRDNVNEEDFEIISCNTCDKPIRTLKASPRSLCLNCEDEVYPEQATYPVF